MSEIVVIRQINISNAGPVNRKGQPIHLQQGSLDGACGPYSLFMALTICGVVKDREHKSLLSADPVRKNSATGKALFHMSELTSGEENLLFRDGVSMSALKEIADKAYKSSVSTEYRAAKRNRKNSEEFIKHGPFSTSDVKDFIIGEVSQVNNNPVILWLSFNPGGHAVVVIGVEYKDRDKKKVARLFLLDPGVPTPKSSAWNSVIEISPRKETHLCWDETGTREVTFLGALAIRGKN